MECFACNNRIVNDSHFCSVVRSDFIIFEFRILAEDFYFPLTFGCFTFPSPIDSILLNVSNFDVVNVNTVVRFNRYVINIDIAVLFQCLAETGGDDDIVIW